MKKLTAILCLIFFTACSTQKTVKIACVGDGTTYGASLENREQNGYPAQLQRLLGNRFLVRNYGVNAATLLKKGDRPYLETAEFRQALKFNPDIVFILLGSNDGKAANRVYLDELEKDYSSLIDSFATISSQPEIVILTPLPVFSELDTSGVTSQLIAEKIIPLVEKTAYKNRCEIIDLFHYLWGQDSLFLTEGYPNAKGAFRLAERLRDAVTIDTISFDLTDELDITGDEFNFHGFRGVKSIYQNVPVRLVQPKKTDRGKPWIWRARFFGHEPQTDIALLERGFHLVYCDVAGLFGAPEAVERWNQFYSFMRQGGLAEKVVLEGMSRGGLIIYNWALANPGKVACIYADAPVLDIKSWPGRGKGKTWEQCKKVYGFNSDDAAKKERVSPVYYTGEIAGAGFPMLHVVGDADRVVPVSENSNPFAAGIAKAGGKITVIHKPGVGHHPHSLKNPQPIVDFILQAAGKKSD